MRKFLKGASAIALATAAWNSPALAACVESPAGTFTCTSGTGIVDNALDGATINIGPAQVISDSGSAFRFGDNNIINVGVSGSNGGNVSSTGSDAIKGDEGNSANIFGEVAAENRGIDFNDDASINIAAGASVTSNTNDAIEVEENFYIVSAGTISGAMGIDGDVNGTIENSGLIEGTSNDAITVTSGADITNAAAGEIRGANRGIDAQDDLYLDNEGTIAGVSIGVSAGDEADIDNDGLIESTTSDAIDIDDDGRIVNGETNLAASITGDQDAIRGDDNLSVENYGSISGGRRAIEADGDGFTLTNFADGEITAGTGRIIETEDDASIGNYGEMTSTSGAGIRVGDDFDIDNYDDGLIQSVGVAIEGGDGVGNIADPDLFNGVGATIRSTGDTAIDVDNDVAIVNQGEIDGQGGNGIQARSGLALNNTADAEIKAGAASGAAVYAFDGQIENSGLISGGSNGIGIHFYNNDESDTTVDNYAGGVITGGTGIQNDASDGGLAITNRGTITGTGGTAILLNDNDDSIINTGGVVNGDIVMGDGANTLQALQGSQITGDVEGGEDVDTVSLDQSSWILGDVNTYSGDDEILLSYGAYITGDIDMGSGDDELSIFPGGAHVIGDVDMGEDDNLVSLAGASYITGDVTAGSGDDRVMLYGDDTRITGAVTLGDGANEVNMDYGAGIFGDVTMGDGGDTITLDFGSVIVGDLSTGGGDDLLDIDSSSSLDGDLNMGSGDDMLVLDTIMVSGTVDMGNGDTDTLVVGPNIGFGMIAFSDNVETFDDSAAPDYVLFTGDYLVSADPAAFAAFDAMASRQTFQLSRSIMDGSNTPGWYGQASAFNAEDDLSGGDLLVGYNTDRFGAFLSWGKATVETADGLNDFDRRALTVGVKGFADLGAGSVTGMAFVGRGDTDIDGDMALLGNSSMDDTVIGMAARFEHLSTGGLGFAAEVGASRIKHDAATAFGLADVTVEERETTVSYLSLEASYDHTLSGGTVLRPFVGATFLSANGDSVTLSAPGPNNSNAPGSTTFGTGADDDLKMLRLGAELAAGNGWSAKLEGQFDDDGNTTGIVSFGMSF